MTHDGNKELVEIVERAAREAVTNMRPESAEAIARAALTAIEKSGRWKIVPVEALRDEARACWELINKAIPHGDLPGDGTDKLAQRNGMILACNIIFDRAFWDRDKPQVGGSPTT